MVEIVPCPFCGNTKNLDLQFREAKGTRRGYYDAAIYCRKCYSYGPRVKSEDVIGKRSKVDTRNEIPALPYKDTMRKAALEKWNRRVDQWLLKES